MNGTKNIQKHMKVSNMTRKKLFDKILYSRFAIHILIFMKILSMLKKELCSSDHFCVGYRVGVIDIMPQGMVDGY